MFGFLAAFGPVGIAAAVIGTVATAVYASSSDSSTASSSDKDTKASDAKKESVENKNEKILKDIYTYKAKEKFRIKKKYNADIEFADNFNLALDKAIRLAASPLLYALSDKSDEKKVKVGILKSSAEDLSNTIATLDKETQEMMSLVEELERMKNETIG